MVLLAEHLRRQVELMKRAQESAAKISVSLSKRGMRAGLLDIELPEIPQGLALATDGQLVPLTDTFLGIGPAPVGPATYDAFIPDEQGITEPYPIQKVLLSL
eukprot:gnl/TRDRNA2_/TRDRNA2_127994_c1_seq1.p2 gnl/TRDRNA2_/TRDRNA2_127994_c1~~gnl/TRDRNA2_/TRDRNA2_127994_c1_seq1.p2  ORF type:complete len:102 (-),score=21.97 gnl/TRDRNA2_/TRDRNA2_127994_c1_seq1:225-530(-)